MEAKIGKLVESVGSFFSGGDTIPWCTRDIIAVRTASSPSSPLLPSESLLYFSFYLWGGGLVLARSGAVVGD
ncbi:hypothetical protein ABZP36_013971 [Zizania latifolia]